MIEAKIKKGIIYGIRALFLLAGIKELIALNGGALVYLAMGVGLCFIPTLYSKWTKVRIPLNACLIYHLFVFLAQFLGTYLGAYGYFHWWDVMLHLVSGILVGYAGLVLLVTLDKDKVLFTKQYAGLLALIIFTITVTGAGCWEIIEFIGDTFLGMNAQLGSLQDTMEDIICGTIIGAGFSIYVGVRMHQENPSCIKELLRIRKRKKNDFTNTKSYKKGIW